MNASKRYLYKIAGKVSAPLRFALRKEFHEFIRPILEKDIQLELERRSLASTAEYVEINMSKTKSYLSKFDLFNDVLPYTDTKGLWLEFGVYRGDTINYIARKAMTHIYGFDSFEGLPEFWRSGFDKGHFLINGLPKVQSNVSLIKGWFENSLPEFLAKNPENRIAMLHVDCDLYSSTKTIFDNCGSRIKEGTIIIFDEYFNYPGWQEGEYKAFQEFIESSGLSYEYIGYVSTHEQVAVKICGRQSFQA